MQSEVKEMKKIVITGTAGCLGPYVAQHFLEHEYEVLSVDLKKPMNLITTHLTANLCNMGECYGAL